MNKSIGEFAKSCKACFGSSWFTSRRVKTNKVIREAMDVVAIVFMMLRKENTYDGYGMVETMRSADAESLIDTFR